REYSLPLQAPQAEKRGVAHPLSRPSERQSSFLASTCGREFAPPADEHVRGGVRVGVDHIDSSAHDRFGGRAGNVIAWSRHRTGDRGGSGAMAGDEFTADTEKKDDGEIPADLHWRQPRYAADAGRERGDHQGLDLTHSPE